MEKLPQLSEEEFEHIEEAIARTQKGRAFLRRLFRRAMGAATQELRVMLDEIRSIWQQQTQAIQAANQVEVLRRELIEMAASIEQARRDVAAMRPPDSTKSKIVTATSELDAIVISTERASIEILNSAERLMEVLKRLRETGVDPALCGSMEAEITDIFTACSFQDLTGQRTRKVVNVLRYIEQRVNAMITLWGEEGAAARRNEPAEPQEDSLLSGPQLEGMGVTQSEIDRLFDAGDMAPGGEAAWQASTATYAYEAPAAAAAASPAPVPNHGQPQSQNDIDRMFDPAPAPAHGQPQSQSDIDRMFDMAPPAAHGQPQSQTDIDRMFDTPPAAPAKPAAKPAAKAAASGKVKAKAAKPAGDPPAPVAAPAPPPVVASAPPAKATVPPPPPPPAPPVRAAAPPAPAPPPPKPAAPAAPQKQTTEQLDQSAIDALFG